MNVKLTVMSVMSRDVVLATAMSLYHGRFAVAIQFRGKTGRTVGSETSDGNLTGSGGGNRRRGYLVPDSIDVARCNGAGTSILVGGH
jgi:hypothetical protein